MKESELSKITSLFSLYSFDFNNKSAYSSISKVSMGFVADKLLKQLQFEKKTNEKEVCILKLEIQHFIFTFLKGVVTKSAIKYAFVRNLCCLDRDI